MKMVIEEIDPYKSKAEDVVNYLPTDKSEPAGFKKWDDYAQALVDRKMKAVDCNKIEKKMGEAIAAVLSIDIRLPKSDTMQQKIPEKLLEFNSPDEGSPILITPNFDT